MAESLARRRATAMLGGGSNSNSNSNSQASRAAANYLRTSTPEEQNAVLNDLYSGAGGALSTIFRAIDTPAAIGRGILAGKPLSGFSWDDSTRVDGQELLEHYGLLRRDADPWTKTFAGIGAEILTDPTSIFTGPARALTAAGKAAKAAGILDSASSAALKTIGGLSKAKKLQTGKASYKALANLLPGGKAITAENAFYRPLVGPRVARSMSTLEQTIQAARDPARAMTDVQNYLKKAGLDYDKLKGQKLGGAFGVDFFGLQKNPVVVAPGKRTEAIMDALDNIGQATRWSAPVRKFSQIFDKRVGGEFDSYGQLSSMKAFDDAADDISKARVDGALHASKIASTVVPEDAQKILGTDNLSSEGGIDFLTRLFDGVPTQGDLQVADMIGRNKIDAIEQSWRGIAGDIEGQASALGMQARNLKSRFNAQWSPRVAKELDFGTAGSGGSGSKRFSAQTTSDLARDEYLDTPGQTVDLRQINRLPEVKRWIAEGEEGGLSQQQVGAAIKEFIDTKHGPDTPAARQYLASLGLDYDPRATPFQSPIPEVDPVTGMPKMQTVTNAQGKLQQVPVPSKTEFIRQDEAESIARTYMRKGDNVDEATGLFSENPINTQLRTMVSQAKARSNVKHMYRSLAEAAMDGSGMGGSSYIPGTMNKPLDVALKELRSTLGLMDAPSKPYKPDFVRDNLIAEIARRNNIDPKTINLSDWTVPEKVINRLASVSRLANSPREAGSLMEAMSKVGQIFRGFLLAFPSRHSRDIYSNAFQLWLLGRSPADMSFGIGVARHVMAGEYTQAAAKLKMLPGYNLADVDAIKNKLIEDVAGTGLLDTLASSDLSIANKTGEFNQLVPGSSPQRALDFMGELIPDGSRSVGQMAEDYFTFADTRIPGLQSTRSPVTNNRLLNASQKLNDYVDSTFRLGGMIMLMKQGVSPSEAAKRVTEALIDYGSLTSVEKAYIKPFFPWWSYSSRAGAFAAKQLLTDPGGPYGQTLRAFNRVQESDDDTYIPEALRQQFAIRIPNELISALGFEPSDNTTFLRDIDIPGHDVLSTFSPKSSVTGTAKSTAYNLLQQMNPLVQTGVELATGQDLFSRRPLEQADSSLDRIYKAASGSTRNMPAVARLGLELLPAPRVGGLVGGMVDQRIPDLKQRAAKQAINALTGIKLQTVDPAYQLGDARRMISEDMSDVMRDYTEKYIPKEEIGRLTPEELMRFRVFNTFGKQLQERRKARAQ